MTLAEENAELKRVLFASEMWRRAYADAKGRMYSRGGEWADFAMNYMPCGEGPLERAVRRVLGDEAMRDLLLKEKGWSDKNDKQERIRDQQKYGSSASVPDKPSLST